MEQKIKNSLLFLVSLFFILSVFGIFYSKTLAIYCIPATLVFLLLLLLLELYLRVQHNIDGLREEVKKQNTVNSDDTAAKPDGLKDEVEKLRKVSEETVDLLEILIDSLEEIKKESGEKENI